MPVNSTARNYVSDVVAGINNADNMNAMQYNFAKIQLTNANDANNASPGTLTTSTLDVIGLPVISALDNGGTAKSWVVYNDNDGATELAASASSAVSSGLADDSVVGVVVGTTAYGKNDADVTLDADGETVTILFRGANNAGVLQSGINYTGGGVSTSANNQTAFELQLQKQGVMVIESAASDSPSYTA